MTENKAGDGILTKLPVLPIKKHLTEEEFNNLKTGDKLIFKRCNLPEGSSGWFIASVVLITKDSKLGQHLVRVYSERFKLVERVYTEFVKYDPEFIAKYAGKTTIGIDNWDMSESQKRVAQKKLDKKKKGTKT